MSRAWRILVGIDFSESAELALAQAVALAESLGAKLELAHVHQPLIVPVPEMALAPPNEALALADAERQIREWVVRVPSLHCTPHVRIGEPVSGLLSLINELSPSFVIVGSHGRGALMRLLLGSVAQGLCQRSPVPVFVVPAKGRSAEITDPN
jgi:nucleotide-binding universal stress UspA family protein